MQVELKKNTAFTIVYQITAWLERYFCVSSASYIATPLTIDSDP